MTLNNIKQKLISLFSNNLYAMSLYSRQIAGTVVLFVIARYLSVYDYGLFSSYKNIAIFCLMFANLGFNEYILVSSKAKVKEVRQKISFFMINAIFVLILTFLLSLFFKMEDHYLFCLVAIRSFFDAIFFALILPYFQAAKKFNVISYINIIYALGITVIALTSYIFKLSLVDFLYLNIALGLLNFIQCSFYAKIKYITVLNHIVRYFKMLDKSIFAYAGTIISFYLYSQIPSLYVSTFLTKTDAALYFAAFTISSVINLFIAALNQKIVPELINIDKSQAKIILQKNFFLLLKVNLLILIFFALTGKFILRLFYGQAYYENAYVPLLILSLSNIWLAMANVYGAYITASGNQKYKIPNQIVAIFISIITLLITFKIGILSACIACFASSLYVAILYTKFALKLLKS